MCAKLRQTILTMCPPHSLLLRVTSKGLIRSRAGNLLTTFRACRLTFYTAIAI